MSAPRDHDPALDDPSGSLADGDESSTPVEDEARRSRGAGALMENVSESTVACLLAMSQGNVLAFGVSHWIIASQTGIAAGILTALALHLSGGRGRWVVAAVLGIATAAVDLVVHPSGFGPAIAEPIVTGAVAAGLSLGVAWLRDRVRGRADSRAANPVSA